MLSRQNLPVLAGTLSGVEENVAKGGYVLSKQTGETPEGILIATGSEVNLAVEAQAKLAEAGVDVSVVSLPSFDLFEAQSEEYKESVLPKAVKKTGCHRSSFPIWLGSLPRLQRQSHRH